MSLKPSPGKLRFCLLVVVLLAPLLLAWCGAGAAGPAASQLNLGVAYYHQQEYKKAQQVFTQILAENPDSFEAHFNMYLTLQAQGHLEDAERHVRRCLELRGEHPGLHEELGNLLFDRGQYAEAAAAYEKELARDQANLHARYNLAMAHLTRGEDATARKLLEEVLATDADFPGAHLALGEVLVQMQEWNEASMLLQQAQAQGAASSRLYLLLGAVQQNLAKYTEAASSYEQALALDAELFEAHRGLGVLALEREAWARAEEHLQQALALAPDDCASRYYLAFVLGEEGKIGEAIEHLEKVAQLAPAFADIQYRLGYFYQQEGALERAREHYQLQLAQDPSALRSRLGIAECYLEVDRSAEACFTLEGVAVDEVTEATLLERLGDLYMACEMYEEAARAYEKAKALAHDTHAGEH